MKQIILALGLCLISASGPLAADTQPLGPTLTLTPAVVLARVKPGQGLTQTLHMNNMTGGTFNFDVEVMDVVVKNGQRTYVPAGETEGGIAANAAITPGSLIIRPQEQGSVTVTLTIPQRTDVRAVVVYFRGKLDTPADSGTVGLGASLGGLITFQLSDDYSFKAVGFSASPQTATTNQVVSHELVNSGSEVVIPKGATVILDDSGRNVAKSTFSAQRLLPGESVTFSATCPQQLKAGHYRVVSSFEFASRIVTADGEFSVP